MAACANKPCKDCPFLKGKSFLDPNRAYDIAHNVVEGGSFACHKTIDHNDDGDPITTSKSKICAGALIMMEKYDPPEDGGVGCFKNQQIRIMSRIGQFNPDNLDLTAEVYESPEEMREGHTK